VAALTSYTVPTFFTLARTFSVSPLADAVDSRPDACSLPAHSRIADMAYGFRRRNLTRIFILISAAILIRLATSSKSSSSKIKTHEIQGHGVLDFVHGSEYALDARRHAFLQSRVGRDEREDLMSDVVRNGVDDYWERFQKP
jgi:hypothetical protein